MLAKFSIVREMKTAILILNSDDSNDSDDNDDVSCMRCVRSGGGETWTRR